MPADQILYIVFRKQDNWVFSIHVQVIRPKWLDLQMPVGVQSVYFFRLFSMHKENTIKVSNCWSEMLLKSSLNFFFKKNQNMPKKKFDTFLFIKLH